MRTGIEHAIPAATKPGDTLDRPGHGECTLLEIVPKGENVSTRCVHNWRRAKMIMIETVEDGRCYLWSVHNPLPNYLNQGRL